MKHFVRSQLKHEMKVQDYLGIDHPNYKLPRTANKPSGEQNGELADKRHMEGIERQEGALNKRRSYMTKWNPVSKQTPPPYNRPFLAREGDYVWVARWYGEEGHPINGLRNVFQSVICDCCEAKIHDAGEYWAEIPTWGNGETR